TPRDRIKVLSNIVNPVAIVHGLIAAVFAAVLNYAINAYNVQSAPEAALKAASDAWETMKVDPGAIAPYSGERQDEITRKLRQLGAPGGPTEARIDGVKSVCEALNQAPPPVFAADGVCRVDSQDDARNNPRVKFASSLSYLADQLDALKQLEGH